MEILIAILMLWFFGWVLYRALYVILGILWLYVLTPFAQLVYRFTQLLRQLVTTIKARRQSENQYLAASRKPPANHSIRNDLE